ncbi:MAG: hypothetical protein INH41_29965 [Myxococcaceae bacterium]|jgi:spermidine synthase|nr:hypothetical protein [Myxococcaceae bacterium]MCA3016631.1 hypothetical protein [Myxococcaceae bacterium]
MTPLPRASALLFFSGFSALVYQTAWTRLSRQLFGASTAATAATLAVFMGGLGLGGWLLGRRVERAPNPLSLYGTLELLVAALAAASLGLLELVSAAYLGTGGSGALGAAGATAVRLLLAAAVMGPCAVVMGATLPAAARPDDTARAGVAVLLGVNTLGAVTGVALTTFVMLEAFGTRDTLLVAALLNALVGMSARSWARSQPQAPAAAPLEAPPSAEPAAGPRAVPLQLVLGAAALVGFAFMLLELVWYRMLAPILGGSTYTFGLILVVALAGLGAGGAAYAHFGWRRSPTLTALAATCAAEALAIMLPFAAGDRVALLAGALRPVGMVGFP